MGLALCGCLCGLFVCLSVCLSVRPSVRLSVCLSVFMLVCVFVCCSFVFVCCFCLFVCPSVCLSVCPFVCLSVGLFGAKDDVFWGCIRYPLEMESRVPLFNQLGKVPQGNEKGSDSFSSIRVFGRIRARVEHPHGGTSRLSTVDRAICAHSL